MEHLPNEILCYIFTYLEKELPKMQLLNRLIKHTFDLEKNSISYKILKKYKSNVIYDDPSYEILKYCIKYNLNLNLDVYDKEFDIETPYEEDHPNILLNAIKNDCLMMVKYLISIGFKISNYMFEYEYTLVNTVKNGNLEMIKFLVENGYKIDSTGGNDLIIENAIINNQLEMFNYLLFTISNYKEFYLETLFHTAVSHNLEITKILLENGADVNDVSDIEITPLMSAIMGEKIEIITHLLKLGATINFDEILQMLCNKWYKFDLVKAILKFYLLKQKFLISNLQINTHLDAVKIVVNSGANIFKLQAYDLMRSPNTIEIINYILRFGLDINDEKKIFIQKLLEIAVMDGNYAGIECLLENGADINYILEERFGNTPFIPLVSAVSDNNLKLVKYLLENGADIQIHKGSAFDISLKRGHSEMHNYLVMQL